MDIRKITKLIDLMIESDLQAIEVKEGDQSIALTRRSPVVAAGAPVAMAAPVAQAPAAKTPRGAVETSPMVGVFYAAPSPGEAPFVKVGQTITAGETLAIIEAMKMETTITAPKDLTVKRIALNEATMVEADDLVIEFDA